MITINRSASEIEKHYDDVFEVKKPHLSKSDGFEGQKLHNNKSGFLKGSESLKIRSVVSLFSGDGGEDLLEENLNEATKKELCSFIFKNVVGYDVTFRGPYGLTVATYMDYIASGRPLKCIEAYIRANVMPTFGNIHTELNFFSEQTSALREEARSIIKKSVNASEDDAVIFCGTGSTTAIHKLIHAMDINKAAVVTGPYEHNSNILPWREMNVKVVTIQQNTQGGIDMDHLNELLKKYNPQLCGLGETTVIGTFSAASNVTGILTDTDTISSVIHKYNGYALYDYACAGPYVNIDMNPRGKKDAYKDAIFISGHKFIGGPQTPGILVAKRWLFKNRVPHGAGGGTVTYVTYDSHHYRRQIEHREEGGTPGIIESVRAGLIFKLKNALGASFIMEKETALFRRAVESWSGNPRLMILGGLNIERLPIFPMVFYNEQTGRFVHNDFITLILNDVFGIQVRSGYACSPLYGANLLGISQKTMKRLENLIVDPESCKPDVTLGKNEFEVSRDLFDNDMALNEVNDDPGSLGNANTNKPVDTSPLHECSPSTKNLVFKPGFVRLSFPYFISEDCFNFVIKAVEMVADKGWSLLPLYQFDRDRGTWSFADKSTHFHMKKSLKEVTFAHGRLDVKNVPRSDPGPAKIGGRTLRETLSKSLGSTEALTDMDYQKIIDRAKIIFREAMTPGNFIVADQTSDFTGEADALRWFMLPSEAANIINNKKVEVVKLEDRILLPAAQKLPEKRTSIRAQINRLLCTAAQGPAERPALILKQRRPDTT